MDSQSAEALAKISEFAPPGLATTAWAYSSLNMRDSTLMSAISAEVSKRISEIEPQSLGILADAGLTCSDKVEEALRPYIGGFMEALPESLDPAAFNSFVQFLHDLHIDNFGARGTRRVLEHMRLPVPPQNFIDRAMEEIKRSVATHTEEKRGNAAADALSGAALVHRRVFSYVEYDTRVGGRDAAAVQIAGSMTKENGRRERGAGPDRKAWPLRAVASPISGLVDRTLCSEFQLLCALMDAFQQAVRPGMDRTVLGRVSLFVSTAPCVSCIGALRQFQLFLPEVRLEVANGEEAYIFCS